MHKRPVLDDEINEGVREINYRQLIDARSEDIRLGGIVS
jgi:hypothetical protein